MSEARGEQVVFGWAGEEPGNSAATAERPSAPRPLPCSARAEPMALPPDNELWDVHAAARFLKRSVSWVYHRAEDGTLPVKRIGGWGLRFIPAELRAWVMASGAPRRRLATVSKE
jgi:hypothetical protein